LLSEIRLLAAASTKESLEISNDDEIFSSPGHQSNVLLKIAIFCGLLRVVGRISTLSPEIRIVSRKSKRVAGNPPKSRNFSARAGSFSSAAELFNLQREIRKFRCSFDFPADDFVFHRRSGFSAEHCDFPARLFLLPPDCLIFRWTSQCSGSACDDPLEI
jgi:hypothetical protein